MGERDYWFISHTTKNRNLVNALVKLLNSCEIPYWIAPEMIPRGSCYAAEITGAIRGCGVFLLVLSEEAQESIYVQREVDMAIGFRKKILSLKINNAALNDMFYFWLNTVQMEDVFVQGNGMLSSKMEENLKELFLRESGRNTASFQQIQKAPEIPKITEIQKVPQIQKIPQVPKIEEIQKVQEIQIKEEAPKTAAPMMQMDTRSNALRVNKIPLQCDYCGEPLQKGVMGIYRCSRCGREHYDDFKKIRNFLEQKGSATIWEISQCTGVALATVKAYFSDASEKPTLVKQNEALPKKGAWYSKWRS